MNIEPHGARIMVVDDDPGILHALSRILGRRHKVTCVSSGPAALEEAQRVRAITAARPIWPCHKGCDGCCRRLARPRT